MELALINKVDGSDQKFILCDIINKTFLVFVWERFMSNESRTVFTENLHASCTKKIAPCIQRPVIAK